MHMAPAKFPYLSAILLSCVVGMLTIMLIPKERKLLMKQVSAFFSGITLLLTLYLFFAYDKGLGGLQFVENVQWIPSLGISYFNAVDGFSLPNLLLTGIVFFTGVLTMWELETRVKEYFALYFLLVTGVFGLFMSMDLFFIFVWYDVSLFPMYLLIAVWGTTRKGIRGHEADPLSSGGERPDSACHYFSVGEVGPQHVFLRCAHAAGTVQSASAEIRLSAAFFGIRDSGGRLAFAYLVAGRTCGRSTLESAWCTPAF